jgi:hypothetical protein
MPNANMVVDPMLEIIRFAPPLIINPFNIPCKISQHIYVSCILFLELFFQLLYSRPVLANEPV